MTADGILPAPGFYGPNCSGEMFSRYLRVWRGDWRKEGTTMNSGHGHVYPREDGVRARCGGPACCHECARDLARQQQERAEKKPEPEIVTTAVLRFRNGSELHLRRHRRGDPA